MVGDRIVRFDEGERILHWVIAALVLVLAITGAILYFDFLSTRVGRRELLRTVHMWSGLALPVPVVGVLAGRWRRRSAPRRGPDQPLDPRRPPLAPQPRPRARGSRPASSTPARS